MRPFRHMLAGIGMTVALSPAIAFADASAAAQAAAREAEGRRLMATRDYAAACAKLAESQSLAPRAGTALDLGTCYEREGKLASAWAAYKSSAAAAVAAHQKPRAVAARKSMTRLEARLSRLTINVADGARASGLEVRCDDEAIDASDWGTAIPRDGGGHDIQASAPGKKSWRTHVDLKANGQNLAVEVPPLDDDGPSPSRLAKAPAPAPASEGAAEPESGSGDNAAHPGQTQRVVGVVVGSAGILGIAAGIIAGINANSANGDLKSACGNGPVCTADNGPSLHDSATTWATVSTIAFIAGGAAVAAGAVLYITAPHGGSSVSVGLAPASQGSGLSLIGRF